MGRFLCLIIAVLLVVASASMLYKDVLYGVVDSEEVDKIITEITTDGEVTVNSDKVEEFWQSISFKEYPFYGNEAKPGITNILEKYVPFINGTEAEMPDVSEELNAIISDSNVLDTLLQLIILAMLSIPVYMLLRLVPFNTLYKASDSAFIISRPALRGLSACACSVVSITITWVLYHTLIYERLQKVVVDWASNITVPEVALNVTNIVILAVAVVCIICLLKSTLFRGSFVKSILLAVARSILFVVIFGVINTFMADFTGRTILFAVVAVIVIGILDMIIDPPKKA